MSKKLNNSSFIEKSNKIHNFKFDYSNINYINNKISIEIICQKHGSFIQLPMHHLSGSGCPKCNIDNRTKSTDNFIKEAIILHGDRYDYTNTKYICARKIVEIVCKKHGSFYQKAGAHLSGKGYGCNSCFIEMMSFSKEEFIDLANIEHNFRYNYDCVNYLGSKNEVMIWCYDHNYYFKQIPSIHLFGHGCPKCGEDIKKISIQEFIDRSNIIHNNKYEYSLVNYINSYTKVNIKCKRHDFIFEQSPFGHLHGRGCFKCAIGYPKLENKWLDSIGITNENKHKIIKINKKIYRVDAYDPATNTVYEFYGDFWHGNPKVFNLNDVNVANNKTFKVLYDNTIKREKEIINAGFNVINIWERDFKLLLK